MFCVHCFLFQWYCSSDLEWHCGPQSVALGWVKKQKVLRALRNSCCAWWRKELLSELIDDHTIPFNFEWEIWETLTISYYINVTGCMPPKTTYLKVLFSMIEWIVWRFQYTNTENTKRYLKLTYQRGICNWHTISFFQASFFPCFDNWGPLHNSWSSIFGYNCSVSF